MGRGGGWFGGWGGYGYQGWVRCVFPAGHYKSWGAPASQPASQGRRKLGPQVAGVGSQTVYNDWGPKLPIHRHIQRGLPYVSGLGGGTPSSLPVTPTPTSPHPTPSPSPLQPVYGRRQAGGSGYRHSLTFSPSPKKARDGLILSLYGIWANMACKSGQ